jgi:teichoic acid glycerol-phosphate primase
MIESVTDFKITYPALALLPGARTSFLDHLIPLCHLWQIPLLCTDPWVYTCAQVFYPPTQIILAGCDNFQQILSNYQTFVSVEPCRLHRKALQFGEFLFKGEGTTIVGFHGNPAKFREEYWIERYAHEDVVLIYGEYLADYFKEKRVWERLKKKVVIGNLRKRYYEKHKPFFDAVAKPHLFPTDERKTVLWAPTWSYPEWSDPLDSLLEKIPSDFQVLIKFHPFMFHLFPEKVSLFKEKYAQKQALLFLDEIPLIYPLLERADIYVGDYSSVAYDFLSFNRPLFLLAEKEYSWATTVKNPQDLFSAFNKKDTLSEAREHAYRYVYGEGFL